MKNFTLRNCVMFVFLLISSTAVAQPTDWEPADPGMEFFRVEKKINVYPNPTAGNVNVALPQGTGNVVLTVMDLLGRVVLQQGANAVDESVISSMDLTNVGSGLMILKISNERETVASKMFIVNRPGSINSKGSGWR